MVQGEFTTRKVRGSSPALAFVFEQRQYLALSVFPRIGKTGSITDERLLRESSSDLNTKVLQNWTQKFFGT